MSNRNKLRPSLNAPIRRRAFTPGVLTQLQSQDRMLIKHDFIDVAPFPILARLRRTHDGVLRRMEVFGGMLILRGIAATDVAAPQAHAQMDPRVVHLQAFFAAVRARLHCADLIEVRAPIRHLALLFPVTTLCRLGLGVNYEKAPRTGVCKSPLVVDLSEEWDAMVRFKKARRRCKYRATRGVSA
jgi:hypothetical protein